MLVNQCSLLSTKNRSGIGSGSELARVRYPSGFSAAESRANGLHLRSEDLRSPLNALVLPQFIKTSSSYYQRLSCERNPWWKPELIQVARGRAEESPVLNAGEDHYDKTLL